MSDYRVIEETRERCVRCYGSGLVSSTALTSGQAPCGHCGGSGFVTTKRVIRRVAGDDIAEQIRSAIACGIRDGVLVTRKAE